MKIRKLTLPMTALAALAMSAPAAMAQSDYQDGPSRDGRSGSDYDYRESDANQGDDNQGDYGQGDYGPEGYGEYDYRQPQDNRSWDDSQDSQPVRGADRNRDSRRDQQRTDQRTDRQRRDDSRRGRDQQVRSQQQGDQAYRLRPAGWVTIAADYDNDGYYDGVETVYYYDLQQAKQRSRQRAQQSARRGDQQQPRSDRQMQQVEGQITQLTSKQMTGGDSRGDKTCRLAKLDTRDGDSMNVWLGHEQDVSQLDLQQGDRVRVEGVRARIDGQQVLLAKRVSAGGDSITNDLPKRQQWQRLSGEVREVSKTSGRDRDTEHTVVKVDLDRSGKAKRIDLGPSDELGQLDIRDGDQIKVLARQGRIGGESILIAQIVRVNGETVDVRDATNKSLQTAARDRNQNEQSRR
ncbi:hypothetical protein [Botrimarina sp.]|uniref:hypothetical protein n=1 Tax=Botrimarina sp. TaxID=2795802 RepID=UPI0032F03F3C